MKAAAPSLAEAKENAAKADDAVRTNFLVGPKAARPTRDELLGVPYVPPMIVAGYLSQTASGFAAPGETGKSTLLLYEAPHVILGLPLYGREIVRPGGVLVITAEDERAIIMSRLNQICRALDLSKRDQNKVLRSFFCEDVTDYPAKLVQATKFGPQPTPLIDEIAAKYADVGLAFVSCDPTSLLGPGEESGNDGMSELMRSANRLARKLQAAVRMVHHVSQNVARGGIKDQYVGRGGTAYSDNSRNTHQLMRVTERRIEHEGSKYELPAAVTDEHLAGYPGKRALALYTHKLSYGERSSAPIILLREGFAFKHVPIEPLDKSPWAQHERREANRKRVVEFVTEQFAAGVKLSKNDLDGHTAVLGMTRDELRGARDAVMALGLLVDTKLPAPECRTKRTRYLLPKGANPANPAESRRKPAGGITKPDVTAAANPAADGTSTRRRDYKGQKEPPCRGSKAGQSRRTSGNPADAAARKKLNGAQRRTAE